MIDYEKVGELHLVTMNDGANTICPEWHQRMLEILDTVEADCGQGTSLVLTGVDKFFCSGLNLEKLMTLSPEQMGPFGRRMAEIHQRFLILPCPTVAAVNGHAFAGGAFMALSCDYRIMREDKGWFCISEVDVGVPIPPAMMGILQGKLPANTARDALLTGKRYTAVEGMAAGIVDSKASAETLLDQAKALANKLATKEPGIFKTLKQTWFGPMADALVAEAG
ncbi:enoyl-CoA hydratase/isomerase family protein [Halioglobus maricola]|uniref:Enoyl-CoA hydratase/isomerase family protein n=1 Tax=Halioglobus maricola TaxID=2601894 RepID=A0A5P9NMA9_9GAMM|nr:enoyl-CoA hydratase/isomerase family protein [Halioglobus maricola]QFU76635.1 enoyl-CoA hydratase/isomerase family protein [Halioglobus maricola]